MDSTVLEHLGEYSQAEAGPALGQLSGRDDFDLARRERRAVDCHRASVLGEHEAVSRIEIEWSTGERSELPGPFAAGQKYTIHRSPGV